jgi:hypothetical protein
MKAMPERTISALEMQILSEYVKAMPERMDIVPWHLPTGVTT